MKAYVAVTDSDWYRYLRARTELDEVNFWQPGGSRLFRTLSPGEPFLFKLRQPASAIVGGAFFAHASLLPLSLAWTAFGEKNGAATFEEMRARIERLRRVPHDPRQNYTIGCVILRDPFFFDDGEWIRSPSDFHPNIVQGKSYDLRGGVGAELWSQVVARLPSRERVAAVRERSGPVFGDPVTVRPRLGQGTFRVLVTDVYRRRCAVTGEKALPVLEAAHIRPVSRGGTHRLDNGLLLRSDVHTLFDLGYISISPSHQVRVSRQLRDEFHNGEHYYQYQDRQIWTPSQAVERPSPEFLEWHADTVFRG